MSAFPVWGPAGIAYSHFPTTGDQYDCSAPGIRTIDPTARTARPVIDRSPDSINLLGFYGLQPLGWLDDSHLLDRPARRVRHGGAVLDLGNKKIRRLGEAFADEISSDGRYSRRQRRQTARRASIDAPRLRRPPGLQPQERLLPGLEPLVVALLRGL